MSEVKVNKISPRSGTTVTLGDSGDTFTIPSGATINNQGTATNFGATGSASWTTTVKTSGFTAVAGEGYFVDTSSGAVSVNLPAGTAGAVVAVKDYANTFDTNPLTLVQNGSDKIGSSTTNATLDTEGIAVTLVFIDSTQGWLVTDSGLQSEASTAAFVIATGGNTVSTCGNWKIHTFTSPGTFCVSAVGNACGSNKVDYMVVAGGGSGGQFYGGGGGAGGFRESSPAPGSDWTDSPLGNPGNARPVSVQGYPITVGAGAAGQPTANTPGNDGSVSTFSDITSAGGGGGGGAPSPPGNAPGRAGGSGGGGAFASASAGAGNTPSTTPPQGNPGGTPDSNSSSGGGAGAPGSNSNSAAGGTGVGTGINPACTVGTPGPSGPLRYFAGGGASAGGGGAAVGGGGPRNCNPEAGVTNTGGGGAGNTGAGGGSGIVILRYKYQ
jgi:hypothetical protein